MRVQILAGKLFLVAVLLLVLAGSAAGTQSVQLNRKVGTATVPNTSLYSNIRSMRVVMRVTQWTQHSAYQPFLEGPNVTFAIQYVPNQNRIELRSRVDATYACSVNMSTLGQDAILEFTRDVVGQTLWCKGWSVDGSASYSETTTGMPLPMPAMNISGGWVLGNPNADVTLDYVRIYFDNSVSSTPPLPMSPGSPELGWEFEGNGAGLHSVNWQTSAPYLQNATKPPAIFLTAPPYTISTHTPAGLDASGSYPISSAGPLTFSWSKVQGPGTVTFSQGTNPATPTVTVDSFGTYLLRATVADAGSHIALRDFTIHSVTTDEQGVVQISDPGIRRILGPMIRYGANPWPWNDYVNKYMADAVGKALDVHWPPYWEVETQPGTTCQVTTDDVNVTCTGTNLAASFCSTGASCSEAAGTLKGGARINFWAVAEDYPGEFIRRAMPISKVIDDTHLVMGQPWIAYYATVCAGSALSTPTCNLKWTGDVDADNHFYNWGCTWCNHANYYDNVLAFYAMYYRTGDEQYLTWARRLADQWWEMPRIARGTEQMLNHMNFVLFESRSHALLGLILRALDGRPEMWKGLYHFFDYYAWANARQSAAPFDNVGDMRETGYWVTSMALCSMYAPPDGHVTSPQVWTDPNKTVKQYCTEALMAKAEFLNSSPLHSPDGNFLAMNNSWGSNGGGSGLGIGSAAIVTTGSSTIRKAPGPKTNWSRIPDANADLTNLPFKVWFTSSMTPQSNADGDSTTYNMIPRRWKPGSGLSSIVVVSGQATATVTEGHGVEVGESIYISDSAIAGLNGDVSVTATTNTTISWSTGSPDGTYVGAMISANDQVTLDRPYEGAGCETGCPRGWFVGGTPGYGTQPFMQGLAANGFSFAYYAMNAARNRHHAEIYRKLAVDGVLWLWNKGRRVNTGGLYYSRGFPGCEQHIATGLDIPPGTHVECTYGDDASNSRVLLGEVQNALSTAYELNPTEELKNIGDEFYTALWSKPGTSTQFPGDGIYLTPMDPAGGYMTTLTNGYISTMGLNKWLGFFFGKGGGYSWPAARVQDKPGATRRKVSLASPLKEYPGGTGMRVTISKADGSRTETLCDAVDCSLLIDPSKGDVLINVEYVSPPGLTRSSSGFLPLRIRP